MEYKFYSFVRHLVYKNGLVEWLLAFLVVGGSYFPFGFLASFFGIPAHPYTEVSMIILLISYLLITMTNYAVQTGIISFVVLYGQTILLNVLVGYNRNPLTSLFLFVAVGVFYYSIIFIINLLVDIDKEKIMRFITRGDTEQVLLEGDLAEFFRKFNFDETYARDLVNIDDKLARNILSQLERSWELRDEDREEISKIVELYRLREISNEEAICMLESMYTNIVNRPSVPLWTWRRV